MTLPVFVPAHHKVNKPETDPPAPTSSFVDDTPSFPDGYYVKVSSPRIPPPNPPIPPSLHFFVFHRSRYEPVKEAAIAFLCETGFDIATEE